MTIILARFWSQILCFIIGIAISAFAVWHLHTYLRDKATIACTAAISAQKTESANACAAATKISEDITRENEAKISDLQRRVADAKRLQPSPTIRINNLPETASKTDAIGQSGLRGGYEVQTGPLYDLAGNAQEIVINFTSLQNYVRSLEPYIAKCEGR